MMTRPRRLALLALAASLFLVACSQESSESSLDDYVGTWQAIEDNIVIGNDHNGVWHQSGGDDEATETRFVLKLENGRTIGEVTRGSDAGRLLYLRLDGKGHLFVSEVQDDSRGRAFCSESATDKSPCGY